MGYRHDDNGDFSSASSEEYSAFYQWLHSLTCDELLQAMQFEFVPSSSYDHTGGGSDEYDLLVEMMELQAPPPTPVHPRGMGYYPRASRHGPQLDYDEVTPRIHPRLFQWTERQSRNYNTLPHHHLRKPKHNKRTLQSQQQQQQTQPRFDVVARNKKTPWGQSLSVGCTRDQQDADDQIVQGTRLSIRGMSGAGAGVVSGAPSNKKNMNHQARSWAKFEPPSISATATTNSTEKEFSTKQSILQMLRIASRGYMFQKTKSDQVGSSKSSFIPVSSRAPYCAPWLNPTERWFSLSFYLASRFQVALWMSYRHSRHNHHHQNDDVLLSIAVPPQPPKDSILEAAMPKAMSMALKQILQEDQREHISGNSSSSSSNPLLLRDSLVWNLLGLNHDRQRQRNYYGKIDPHWVVHCLRPQRHQTLISKEEEVIIDWGHLWNFWSTTPLVQVKSPMTQVRLVLSKYLDAAIAMEVEKELLLALEEDDSSFMAATTGDRHSGTRTATTNSVDTSTSTTATPTPTATVIKQKKKRKKKRSSKPPPQQEEHQSLQHYSLITIGPPHVIEEEPPHLNQDGSNSGSGEEGVTTSNARLNDETGNESSSPPPTYGGGSSSTVTTTFAFPTPQTTPLERNRSVIFALTILDEILEAAFDKAGLLPTPKFEDDPLEPPSKLRQPVPAPSSLPWNRDIQRGRIQQQQQQSSGSVGNGKKKKKKKKKRKGQRRRPQEQEQQVTHLRQPHQRRPAPDIEQSHQDDIERYGTRYQPNYSRQIPLGGGSEHSTSRAFDSEWTNGLWQPLAGDSKKTWPMLGSTTGGSSDDSGQETRHWPHETHPEHHVPPKSNYDSAFHRHNHPQQHSHNLAGSSREFPMFGAASNNNSSNNNNNSSAVIDEEGLDGWPFFNRYQARERSILAEFFRSQEERIDADENLMAASTAASIASSAYKDVPTVTEADDVDKAYPSQDEKELANTEMNAIAEGDVSMQVNTSSPVGDVSNSLLDDDLYDDNGKTSIILEVKGVGSPRSEPHENHPIVSFNNKEGVVENEIEEKENGNDGAPVGPLEPAQNPASPSPTFSIGCRSPSPEAPLTPPPTLSPILVSLADLKNLKTSNPERLAHSVEPKKTRSYSAAVVSGSLPSSPVPKNGLTPSWSREDLRIAAFRDDHSLKQMGQHHGPQHPRSAEKFPALVRPAPIKSLAKPIASSRGANFDFRIPSLDSSVRRDRQGDSCARSETAVEVRGGDQHWQHDIRRIHSAHGQFSHGLEDVDNGTKDESTTITSALSNRENEEMSHMREERNTFRDMCLTLGAEVAKLKAVLAAQKATAIVPALDYSDGAIYGAMYGPNSFDPNGMAPFFHGIQRGKRLGPMSDAGIHRPGDHESQVSEDDVYDVIPKPRVDNVRRLSSSATIAGSDVSVEFNNSNSALQGGLAGVIPAHEAVSVHGLQSRLTKDILNFLKATSMQLKKQDTKRGMAIERFTRLVISLWPRAQVKLYGSHVAGLCLPSSDLDFVIRLPAVHKNAPALAPGVLEGRNAINESSQKLLARQLKGESWIDPRSIKLIERTVVPVIKVSTKDTRARMIALDISFDSPEHHGLMAIEMVSQTLDELPLIRPLVLVLKQFLLDRGLLTAYTGGVSSYCLFLMVARYLQDQPSNIGDCGSLLMGFLDFYGNCFDPRTTGVSVRRKQYFARPNYAVAHHQASGQPMWSPSHQQHVASPPQVIAGHPGHPDFLRRNSFGDNTNPDGVRARPPRFQPVPAAPHRYVHHNIPRPNEQPIRPFTFDPLFVEDPLAVGNNVGRNAFRVNQVQRAFSDAHRALVASLEWDINSSGELNDGVDYPLLKCLLKGEDVLYDL